ncbi:MAG: hypothetical protein KJO79_04505 [Verrucomicrobiae bacterium]|nr:hypothetical protein [Verrucomicrobiae bacterium]NNJ86419.1 hypothetical protein [Akkermansiaceae bacterium]
MKRIILATIAGAIVAFLWGFVSWSILPWHKPDTFTNDEAVAKVIKENAPSHGLYMLPASGAMGPDTVTVTEGPFVYAIVRPGKLDQPWTLVRPMMLSFGIQMLGALMIAIGIHRIRASRYISRASVGPAMGLFAGVIMTLPYWNWFELPQSHTLAQLLDPLITWTLAGLVIAAIVKTPPPRRIFS